MLLSCLKWRFLLQVRSTGGEWRTVEVPSSVKAIVVLNLQSYAGGRDLWGLKDTAKDTQKGWRTPIFNDGTIEVGVMLTTAASTPAQTASLQAMGSEASTPPQTALHRGDLECMLPTCRRWD